MSPNDLYTLSMNLWLKHPPILYVLTGYLGLISAYSVIIMKDLCKFQYFMFLAPMLNVMIRLFMKLFSVLNLSLI